ncbi:TPA: glucosyltransferase domain-containing protein [Streptococcus suis]
MRFFVRYKEFILAYILPALFLGHFIIFPTVGIDTENAILHYDYLLLSWETIGRIGLVGLKKLFFPTGYSATVNNILMILVFGFFLHFISKKLKVHLIIFSLTFLALPITYFQLYFQLQNAEVVFTCLLVVLSAYYFSKATSWYTWIIPIIIFGFSISVYQSFLDFIIASTSYFLLQNENESQPRLAIVKLFLTPCFSLVVYWLLNLLFNQNYGESDYLHILFLSKVSLLAIFVIIFITIVFLFELFSKKIDIHVFFLKSAFYCSPFITLALVGNLQYRALFPTFPFVAGIFFSSIYDKNKNLKHIIESLLIAFTLVTAFLVRQNYRQYQDDRNIAQTIKEAIPNSDYRVQFIGKYQENRIPIIIAGEPVGKSFFWWDPLPSQQRSDNFLKLEGVNYIPSTLEQNQENNEQSLSFSANSNISWIKMDDVKKVVYIVFE